MRACVCVCVCVCVCENVCACGLGLALPIESNTRDRTKYRSLLNICLSLVVVVFVLFGYFGYTGYPLTLPFSSCIFHTPFSRFGSTVSEVVTLSLPHAQPGQVLRYSNLLLKNTLLLAPFRCLAPGRPSIRCICHRVALRLPFLHVSPRHGSTLHDRGIVSYGKSYRFFFISFLAPPRFAGNYNELA